MADIRLLSAETIDKIAAGEVIERPASVVKELVENAIDAGSSAITVEIRDGGTSLIRVTDNGSGISPEQLSLAFQRHSTSKIRTADDLFSIRTLGFRGEALSSIAAVSETEVITKTRENWVGMRLLIAGGVEKAREEIGAPDGTTFLVHDLFFNTPVRKKFLKSNMTEASYITDLMEKLALSHPDISVRLIVQGQTKLHTSGTGRLRDVIYSIFGREMSAAMVPLTCSEDGLTLEGYIGKPSLSKGNRSGEIFFVNGRHVKSNLVSRAIEQAYHGMTMQHKFPVAIFHLTLPPDLLDVNVHPTKTEVRFRNEPELFDIISRALRETLLAGELMPSVREGQKAPVQERKKLTEQVKPIVRPAAQPAPASGCAMTESRKEPAATLAQIQPVPSRAAEPFEQVRRAQLLREEAQTYAAEEARQLNLFEEKILTPSRADEFSLIGQLFDTYWLVRYRDMLLIVDQHAAHEKILYERSMKAMKMRTFTSQQLRPPIIMTLDARREECLKRCRGIFEEIGFEIEPFGGREYAVYAVPDNLYGIAGEALLVEMLDSLSEEKPDRTEKLLPFVEEKVALMSCKAAVKGNSRLSAAEAEAILRELLALENPYTCPHGRPTVIKMTRTELEKKFKRIV